MLLEYKCEGMTLRSDNDSQFIAAAVRSYLKEKGVLQEFSHVATLEDNAFIEALHSNLQREVIDRFEFDSIYHAQIVLNAISGSTMKGEGMDCYREECPKSSGTNILI